MHTFYSVFLPLAVATLSSAAAISARTSPSANVNCTTGVHVIVARGTFEPQTLNDGEGFEASVVNAIAAAIPGSDGTGVVYPAAFQLPSSPNNGTANMQAQAIAYAKACPKSKMVLMGWSQGGIVVGDAVAGGGNILPGGTYTAKNPPLPASVMSKVVSIIVFGDLTQVTGHSYNVDGCQHNSAWPRAGASLAKWNSYTPLIQSYCAPKDGACCGLNGTGLIQHLTYFSDENNAAVANFVKKRFDKAS